MTTITDVPRYLQVEPAGECNLRCAMCARLGLKPRKGLAPAFMARSVFSRLLAQLSGVERVHLQGLGEPLLHPEFVPMVWQIAARGVRVTTNTNLSVMNERRAAEIVESGLEELYVSIDGATAATYERIRKGGRFRQLLRHLALVRKAKEKGASQTPVVRFAVVLMKSNVRELPGIVRLAARHGVPSVYAQNLCFDFSAPYLAGYDVPREFFRRETLLDAPERTIAPHFDAARRTAEETGVELTVPKMHRALGGDNDACEWPWKGLYVDCRGEISACCMAATPDRIALGNVLSVTLKEAWQGAVLGRLRKDMARRKPPRVCYSCAMHWGAF